MSGKRVAKLMRAAGIVGILVENGEDGPAP